MNHQSKSNPFGRKPSRDIDVEAVFGELGRVQTSSLAVFRSAAFRPAQLPVDMFEERLAAVHGETKADGGEEQVSNTGRRDLQARMAASNHTLAQIASKALPEQEFAKQTAAPHNSRSKPFSVAVPSMEYLDFMARSARPYPPTSANSVSQDTRGTGPIRTKVMAHTYMKERLLTTADKRSTVYSANHASGPTTTTHQFHDRPMSKPSSSREVGGHASTSQISSVAQSSMHVDSRHTEQSTHSLPVVRSSQPAQVVASVASTGKFKVRDDDAVAKVFGDWEHMPADVMSSKLYIASHKDHEKALHFATRLTQRMQGQVFPERWEPMLSEGFKTTTKAGTWVGLKGEKHVLMNTDILRIRHPVKGVRAVELYLSDTLVDVGIQMLAKQMAKSDEDLEQSMLECNLYPARHGQALHYGRASKLMHMLRKPKPHSLRPLWDKERILIPICGASHWYLIVVMNPGALIKPAKTNSRNIRTVDDKCLIVALDSMTVKRDVTFDAVDDYLRDRAHKEGKTIVRNPVHLDLLVPAQPNAYDCGIFTIFYAAIVFSRGDWFKDVVQSQLDLATAVTSGTHVGFAVRWNEVKMITDLRDGIRNALAAEVQDDAVRLTTGNSDESDESEVEVLGSSSSHTRTVPRKKLPRGSMVPSFPICKDDVIDID